MLSVIIPTYNRCESLCRALNSVSAQGISSDIQVIIVDDGSTDQTQSMISQKYPQHLYIHQNNQGVSSARNNGIQHAGGQWIAFLDSDDEWLPNKLQRQFETLAKFPNYRIIHTNEIWIRNGVRVNPMKKHTKYGGWIFEQCLPLCAISPSSVMIHRSVFDQVGLFDESLPACEDYDLWLRICAFHPAMYIDEPLIVKYGGHEDQLSCKFWGMDRFRIYALDRLIRAGGLNEKYENSAIKMLIHKTQIYLKGARKRNKTDETHYYEKLLDNYLQLL